MVDEDRESSDADADAHPRRRRLPATLVLAFLGALAIGASAYWLGYASALRRAKDATAEGSATARARYTCPMHPSVVQDHEGDCPICGMKLVRVDEPQQANGPAGAPHERKIRFYRSPMDPKVTSPTPSKDEMGMDYVPVYADDTDTEPAIRGQATVEIDPARQQLIGLTTARVTAGAVGGAWRTVGRIAVDETRVRHINVKVPGYVERIYVDYVGKAVRKGDPLFALYSPELLSTQQEYLLALRTQRALATSGGTLGRDGDELVRAARRKLSLWDVPEAEIDRIAKTGEPTKTLTFYSPGSGVVTSKNVVEGMKLEAGAMPYEVVDLSHVWVLADVYENELRHVRVGMPASLTLNAFPSREFKGKVLFVDPLLDPQTRTVKVRLAFPNPDGDMRPEMFGEVVLHGQPRQGLRIPEDAVIDSGTEDIVFVALGEGKFQPRKVRLGDVNGNSVEVVSGVVQGEEVVTRANFLIDSESKLRASLAELSGSGEQMPESARVLPEPSAEQPEPDPKPSKPARERAAEAAPLRETAHDHYTPVPATEPAHDHGGADDAVLPASGNDAAQRYWCPMHPSVVQDHPGKCPFCGMKLVPKNDGASTHAGGAR